jgi:60 kDa SS-A/Ro ribonucleoprotein
MKLNIKAQIANTLTTHEGGPAVPATPLEELRRTVMACMLWENNFYEDGVSVANRIATLVAQIPPAEVAALAREARSTQHLRHVPLLLMRELARNPRGYAYGHDLSEVIQRADELAEFLAIYWKGGKEPLGKQTKKGLANAFQKFDEYALAKYNRDAKVRLRDVLFMVHAKPKDEAQAALWKRVVDKQLAPAGTWEERLSAGQDKREVFEDLLRKRELGYLALLRNLRNMHEAGVDTGLVFDALNRGAAKSRALPFRFVAAARAVPAWESKIDEAMQIALEGVEKLAGETVVLVDVSGSMDAKMSEKSDLNRIDAAAALAILVNGICEKTRVFAFSDSTLEVPARSGMALADAITQSMPHNSTLLGEAVKHVALHAPTADRLIVVTDEQSQDAVGAPNCRGYMINVATNKNGVGYGDWTRINGFSESIVRYIVEMERLKASAT